MAQTYDKDGTTRFEFTFADTSPLRRESSSEWYVLFEQGHFYIRSRCEKTLLKMNFPQEDHWTYEECDGDLESGVISCGAEIKNKHFTLTASFREYKSMYDDDFDPTYHDVGENEGLLRLLTKDISVNAVIPYKLAIELIKFMAGSTELKGVFYVRKS